MIGYSWALSDAEVEFAYHNYPRVSEWVLQHAAAEGAGPY